MKITNQQCRKYTQQICDKVNTAVESDGLTIEKMKVSQMLKREQNEKIY